MFTPQTDEERDRAHQSLLTHFAYIEHLQQKLQVPLPLDSGTVLELDDRRTRPYQISHTVNYLILTAVDHLHCLRTAYVDAGALHIFAPFTLIRSAIEAASTAVWLLAPEDRLTRRTRSLRLERNNLTMLQRAYSTLDADTDETLTPRLMHLGEAIIRAGVNKDLVMGSFPGIQTIITTAANEADLSKWVLGAWQMTSGVAHGRSWAGSHTSTFTEAPESSTEEVLSGVLTSNETMLAHTLLPAIATVDKALKLQEIRARRRHPAGASFFNQSGTRSTA